jgi:antitoxin (DNA-binding transcriptional repressor) of toxin-antitoxin stability system
LQYDDEGSCVCTWSGAVETLQKVIINELSPELRAFLARVRPGRGIVIEDENGRAICGVIPLQESTAPAKAKAWKHIQKIQRKVGRMMKKTGKKEEDLDHLLD